MRIRFLLGEILFWSHVPVILFWFGLFFVPSVVWPAKMFFHFWFIALAFASQLLWGLLLMPIRNKFGWGVCFLTTLTQLARGYPLRDPRNHDHWFLSELFDRAGVTVPASIIQFVLVTSILLVATEYLLI